MNEKTIQCLPNPSQHVLIYLQEFPNYTMLKSMRKSKNRYFHLLQPTFLFLLETPLRLSRSMLHGWKDSLVLAKPLAACTHISATVSQLFELQVQKIAVFTYCSLHYCFPCDYHAVCCMNEKTIQCLPNPPRHLPIYLQLAVWLSGNA